MKKECVFRAEFEGSLWRVERDALATLGERRIYRIVKNQKCYVRFADTDARNAIRICLQFALGHEVIINWSRIL